MNFVDRISNPISTYLLHSFPFTLVLCGYSMLKDKLRRPLKQYTISTWVNLLKVTWGFSQFHSLFGSVVCNFCLDAHGSSHSWLGFPFVQKLISISHVFLSNGTGLNENFVGVRYVSFLVLLENCVLHVVLQTWCSLNSRGNFGSWITMLWLNNKKNIISRW